MQGGEDSKGVRGAGGGQGVGPARSPSLGDLVRALFGPETVAAPPGPPSPPGRLPFPRRDRFTTRVARYLQGGAAQRDRLVGGILDDAAWLSEAGEAGAVAEAVHLLVRQGFATSGAEGVDAEGGDAPDPGRGEGQEFLSLALEMVDPRVARTLVEEAVGGAPFGEVTLRALAGRLAPAVAEALAEADERVERRRLLSLLVGLGEPGRGAARELLRDARWYAVRNGIIALVEMEGAGAEAEITPLLAHPDPRVREEAAGALGGEDLTRG